MDIKNFSFSELTHTDTGYNNIPDDMNIIKNLTRLAEFLQQIRNELHLPITVNSAYRSEAVNKAVGGVSTSYHCRGLAADIRCSDMDKLLMILRENLSDIDQMGLYYNGKEQLWIHVGLPEEDKSPRNQIYTKEM